MKRMGSEVVGSLFWLGVGVFFAVGGILLKPGTARNPGPGFLPLVMALLLMSFSLWFLAQGLVGPAGAFRVIRWKRQAVLVACVFLYGILLDLLGFLLSTFVLMSVLFSLSFTEKHTWTKVLFLAAATALIGWLVFSVALKVPFPHARLMVVQRWSHGFLW